MISAMNDEQLAVYHIIYDMVISMHYTNTSFYFDQKLGYRKFYVTLALCAKLSFEGCISVTLNTTALSVKIYEIDHTGYSTFSIPVSQVC